MPLFAKEVASGLTDRIAAIVKNTDLLVIIPARNPSAPGNMFRRVALPIDYDVANDFNTPTTNFENVLSGTTIFAGVQQTTTLVNAFDTHCQRVASTTFDKYLNASGLQVSEVFARLYGTVRSSQLSAHNVFIERDIVMATVTKTAGVWAFGAGQNLGAGTGTFDPTIPNTGEQFVIAALQSGVTTGSLTINVSGLDDAGHVQQASKAFGTNVSGVQTQVSTALKYRTVTNAQITGDDGIPNGTVVSIFNKRERVVVY